MTKEQSDQCNNLEDVNFYEMIVFNRDSPETSTAPRYPPVDPWPRIAIDSATAVAAHSLFLSLSDLTHAIFLGSSDVRPI